MCDFVLKSRKKTRKIIFLKYFFKEGIFVTHTKIKGKHTKYCAQFTLREGTREVAGTQRRRKAPHTSGGQTGKLGDGWDGRRPGTVAREDTGSEAVLFEGPQGSMGCSREGERKRAESQLPHSHGGRFAVSPGRQGAGQGEVG